MRSTHDKAVDVPEPFVLTEIASQQESWRRAAGLAEGTTTDMLDLLLDFADERSVAQTRFGTRALASSVDDVVTAEQISFLGTGWTVGLGRARGLDADRPRDITRAVELPASR